MTFPVTHTDTPPHTYGPAPLPHVKEHPWFITGFCLLSWKAGLDADPKNPMDREKGKLTKQNRKDSEHGRCEGGRQAQWSEDKLAKRKTCLGEILRVHSQLQGMGPCLHPPGKTLSPLQPEAGVPFWGPWSPKTQPHQRTRKGSLLLALPQSSVVSKPQNRGRLKLGVWVIRKGLVRWGS